MVWFKGPTGPIQQAPIPPRPDERVHAVAPVNANPQRRSPDDRNRRRRHLFDILMQEVDEIPDLEPTAKERLRSNLRQFAGYVEEEPPRRASPPPRPKAEPNPPHLLDDHRLHAEHVVATLALGQAAGTDEGGRTDPTQDEAAAEALRVAEQLRRCLAVHSERARKISSYIHAIQALTSEIHTLEVEA